jgi:hypothetical protein
LNSWYDLLKKTSAATESCIGRTGADRFWKFAAVHL